jgi:hypothetical protein
MFVTVALIITVALLAYAIPRVVRALRRESQHVDAIRWDFQRSTDTAAPTTATPPASKETPTA